MYSYKENTLQVETAKWSKEGHKFSVVVFEHADVSRKNWRKVSDDNERDACLLEIQLDLSIQHLRQPLQENDLAQGNVWKFIQTCLWTCEGKTLILLFKPQATHKPSAQQQKRLQDTKLRTTDN